MSDSCQTSKICFLPKRPEAKAPLKEREISLKTNLFKVKINFKSNIYAYHLDIFPEVQADNRQEKRRILIAGGDLIKSKIGNFANSGQNLYGIVKPIFEGGVQQPADFKPGKGKVNQHIWLKLNSQDIFLRIRLARTVKLQDLSNEKDRFPIPLQFLDKLLGTMMRSLNLRQVGKARAFVDGTTKQVLNCGVALFSGYFASFNLYSQGLFLKVDTCTKIVRTKTVLQRINQIYEMNSTLNKEARRQKVKQQLIGQVVMANYGNSKHWKIQDFVFDQDTTKFTFSDVTMSEYYKQKYQLIITAPKQPFIQSYFSKNDQRPCFLLPEFLYLTGMPEGDQRIRRQVSSYTIRPPQQKLNKVCHLLQRLSTSTADLSLKSLSQKLDLTIESNPYSLNGTVLNTPRLLMGGGKYVDESKATSFTWRNLPIFKCNKAVDLTIAFFSQVDIHTIEKSFSKLANQSQIEIKINCKNLGQFRNKGSLEVIKDYISYKSGQSKDNSIIMVVLPNQMKPFYKQLKIASLISDSPILTQMVLEATLKKKGLDSILTKVLLQLTAKVGNNLWSSSMHYKLDNKVMLIGVHQTGKLGNKSRVVTAFSATISDSFQQYFSKSYVTDKSVLPVIEKMSDVIGQSLKGYVKSNNGKYPDEIIILRNGSTDNMEQIIFQNQVQKVITFLSMKQCRSKLSFISIDAKPSHKFFAQKNGRLQNPPCGTVINKQVVSPYYDFYLYPALCNMGAAVPVRYKIIYSDSKIEPNHLQTLLYSQCFNYANWTGSIRYPACLQYAKKLSQYVSEQIDNSLPSEILDTNLYFI